MVDFLPAFDIERAIELDSYDGKTLGAYVSEWPTCQIASYRPLPAGFNRP